MNLHFWLGIGAAHKSQRPTDRRAIVAAVLITALAVGMLVLLIMSKLY